MEFFYCKVTVFNFKKKKEKKTPLQVFTCYPFAKSFRKATLKIICKPAASEGIHLFCFVSKRFISK